MDWSSWLFLKYIISQVYYAELKSFLFHLFIRSCAVRARHLLEESRTITVCSKNLSYATHRRHFITIRMKESIKPVTFKCARLENTISLSFMKHQKFHVLYYSTFYSSWSCKNLPVPFLKNVLYTFWNPTQHTSNTTGANFQHEQIICCNFVKYNCTSSQLWDISGDFMHLYSLSTLLSTTLCCVAAQCLRSTTWYRYACKLLHVR